MRHASLSWVLPCQNKAVKKFWSLLQGAVCMCSVCSASQAQAAAAAGLGLGALAVIIALSILASLLLLGLGAWVWLRRMKHKLRRAMPGFIEYADLNLKPSRWECIAMQT